MKSFSLFLLSVAFFLYGCDKCKDVNCEHGNCEKGDCNCYDYYEGSLCEIEMREKFYGRYNGSLNWDGGGEDVYTVLSEAGDEVSKINWDYTAYLEITGSTEFKVPEQISVINGDTYVLRGEGGSLDYKKLTINFSTTYEGYTMYFKFVGYPQLKKGQAINEHDVLESHKNIRSVVKKLRMKYETQSSNLN